MSSAPVPATENPKRDRAIDQARGVAALIMIQGHAFHAWVAPAHKSDPAYLFTRIFATLPLPAFLVLAGASVAYRVHFAARKGEPAERVRSALLRRGLQVTAIGYLVNLAFGMLDGIDGIETLLRADVLQVIGLSIATLGVCVAADDAPPSLGQAVKRAALLGALVTLLCPPVSAWAAAYSPQLALPLRALLAPLWDVPGLTQMPLIPLFAWAALGLAAGAVLARSEHPRREPVLQAMTVATIACILGGHALQEAWLDGQRLSRAHPAVVGNVLAYGGRGLLLLALAPLLVPRLPQAMQEAIERLGRASLWAYVFHIPFCYGRFGKWLFAQHSVGTALPYVASLMLASYAVVHLRLTWGARASHKPSPARLESA